MSQALRGAIQLPEGTLVRGRALRDRIPNGPLPDYGLFEPSWEADWILWLDSRTPADPQEAAHAIVKAFRSTSRPPGGTGRQVPLDQSVTRLPRELAGVGVDPNRELVVLTHEPFAQ